MKLTTKLAVGGALAVLIAALGVGSAVAVTAAATAPVQSTPAPDNVQVAGPDTPGAGPAGSAPKCEPVGTPHRVTIPHPQRHTMS
ncbi:hypothetical protein [Amycolatopsis saalfeldensis]|uniref:Uncharacterized protein n=1 Tax=Amycolatopsis saalfeldensis TaxID=394193 RepID=A0A1H8U5H5_9PSEU|nr:hypothetical protein [Amycolatopsis saalfeldensis]SEO98530.1 hypothetical protein SAMN04489732_10382 [Amycolatopsis saalfeldensis]